jgi:starvation-inducible outer membrane lipoprotein
MKKITIALLTLPLVGCTTLPEYLSAINFTNKVDESNYMSTPCVWDGATVKKKPKIKNVL